MTDPYRAMCAELTTALEYAWDGRRPKVVQELIDRARALLAQPVAEGPKPMVDYSRVPEMATEAQIRSAAQYLVKKRNCDGDLIPAIEYAIARWGHPTQQPVAEGPTIPSSKLHRQELTPLEITLLIEALDFAIGDIKARPNSSNHVAVRAKLKRSISRPKATND
jgi:hypothetical protein